LNKSEQGGGGVAEKHFCEAKIFGAWGARQGTFINVDVWKQRPHSEIELVQKLKFLNNSIKI
jgi:hypothetical protein